MLRTGPAVNLVLAAAMMATAACSNGGGSDAGTDGPPAGSEIFRSAVNGAPGGALLSVWARPNDGTSAFIVGGYVGVEPAMVTDGAIGRLVEYTNPGVFTTRCTTDQVLWWVDGTRDEATGQYVLFAGGEGGKVIRYQDGRCETLNVDVTYPAGVPTFWGVRALSPTDVWFVGGSALPTGPTGVLVHYDGAHFTQAATLPVEAQRSNLYKIDVAMNGAGRELYVVGANGIILHRVLPNGDWAAVATNVRAQDNRLFTVSCASAFCYAVGGAGTGVVLSGNAVIAGSWQSLSGLGDVSVDELPGLNGVWVESASSVFVVGVNGFTLHTNGMSAYRPPVSATMATLHAVNGARGPGGLSAPLVIAVGGELGVANATQRAVILVRGDSSASFSFDGTAYMGSGVLRPSLGGAGQGGGGR